MRRPGRNSVFDEHFCDSLAVADSNATIPPGIVISASNWLQYKQFVLLGLQILLAGEVPTFAAPARFPDIGRANQVLHATRARIWNSPGLVPDRRRSISFEWHAWSMLSSCNGEPSSQKSSRGCSSPASGVRAAARKVPARTGSGDA
jgi:hypothetical protein